MKLPRDESGLSLIKKLSILGYFQTRQVGSHIRLTRTVTGSEQHITIPNHNPLRIGTLSDILSKIAIQLGSSKKEIIKKLYE